MNVYRNIFSAVVILMSSILLISCNQSSNEQSGDVNTNQDVNTDQSVPTIATNKSGPSVILSDSDIDILKGDTFSLDITTKDFPASEGGGISLHFNPALLQVAAVDIDGTVWDFTNKDGQIDNTQGIVSDILFSSYQSVTGDVKIATVEFKSIEKGMSEITLEASSNNPFASDGQNMLVTFTTTNVSSN